MSPVTPEQRIMYHFTHNHVLTEYNGTGEFTCNGCNRYGSSGTTYRCGDCNYDLHEYCATCPLTLRNFSHPPHDLRLAYEPTPPEPTPHAEPRVCDVCERPVDGLFYECEPCVFRVHPLCTKLPQFVRHALHPEHPLELFSTTTGACVVCGGACTSWRYSCFACGLHVHMKCLAATEMKQRSAQPQQQHYYAQGVPHHYAYGQPPSSPQYYAQGVHDFGYGTAPSSPQYVAGRGGFSGHRRINSCGPNIDGGYGGNETPRKNYKGKGIKTAARLGVTVLGTVLGVPGVEFLIDKIQGSDSSNQSVN